MCLHPKALFSVNKNKLRLCVGLIFLAKISFAQPRVTASQKKDPAETSPVLLAKKLTETAKTEKEKVTAIFRWITDNIYYNSGIFYKTPKPAPILFPYEVVEDTGALPSLNDRVAEGVLRRRVAICDGYARLFASLCFHAGLQSEIISGYARTRNNNGSSKFRSNHSWNAVMIDSTWHLLDATWASGYFINGSNEFIQQYSHEYFLSDPKVFIKDHYPEDLKWTLLTETPTLEEFKNSPFRYGAFAKYKIQSFKPANGIIEVAHGDSIQIELETGVKEKKIFVTTFLDSLSLEAATADAKVSGEKVSYNFKVLPGSGEWLNVVYNGEAILRYKLALKKQSLPE